MLLWCLQNVQSSPRIMINEFSTLFWCWFSCDLPLYPKILAMITFFHSKRCCTTVPDPTVGGISSPHVSLTSLTNYPPDFWFQSEDVKQKRSKMIYMRKTLRTGLHKPRDGEKIGLSIIPFTLHFNQLLISLLITAFLHSTLCLFDFNLTIFFVHCFVYHWSSLTITAML